jgi:isopenicillin N synthase-like dioxygenase
MILRYLAKHLGIPESIGGENYFESKHSLDTPSSTILRLLHYQTPPVSLPLSGNLESAETEVRCGCHSDYGTLTLLFQDMVGGLQVMIPKTSAQEQSQFINVLPKKDHIVVNCADLFQFWTDSYYISAQHRVVGPKQNQMERFSIAYFMQPEDGWVVEKVPLGKDAIIYAPSTWTPQRYFEQKRMKELAEKLPSKFTSLEYLQGRLKDTFAYFSGP